MKPRLRTILASAAALLAFSQLALADPVVLTPGGPSVTLLFTSALSPSARAEATFTLNAAGTQVTAAFRNTSAAGSGIGIYYLGFNSPLSYFNGGGFIGQVTGLPPGVSWVGPTDNFGATSDFVIANFFLPALLDPSLPLESQNVLLPGQGGIITLTFMSPRPPFEQFLLDPTAGFITPDRRLGGGQSTVIPEPATLVLCGSGLLAVAVSRRRRRKRKADHPSVR